jgi:hypothetical protein
MSDSPVKPFSLGPMLRFCTFLETYTYTYVSVLWQRSCSVTQKNMPVMCGAFTKCDWLTHTKATKNLYVCQWLWLKRFQSLIMVLFMLWEIALNMMSCCSSEFLLARCTQSLSSPHQDRVHEAEKRPLTKNETYRILWNSWTHFRRINWLKQNVSNECISRFGASLYTNWLHQKYQAVRHGKITW